MEPEKGKDSLFTKVAHIPNYLSNKNGKKDYISGKSNKLLLPLEKRTILPNLSGNKSSRNIKLIDKDSSIIIKSKSVINDDKMNNNDKPILPSLKGYHIISRTINQNNRIIPKISKLTNNNSNNDNLVNNNDNNNESSNIFENFKKESLNNINNISNINNNINNIESKDGDFFTKMESISKEATNSSCIIPKIKLNNFSGPKKEIRKMKVSLSCKNCSNSATLNPVARSMATPKFSNFFKISQKNDVSARKIYNHYLEKSESCVTKPIKNYKKFFDKKTKNYMEKLNRIYCENPKFSSVLREIKENRRLAYKDDFNIEEYQALIIELMESRVSQKNLLDLQKDYRAFNQKLFGLIEPKGRFTILADKLRYNLPAYLLEKLKQLDKDAILTRMKYYNQFKEFKNENKLVSRFDKKLDCV